MVDCITICNSACIACIWCILFSVWYDFVTASQSPFPRFSKNLRKVDSSECCIRRKSIVKHRKARSRDFPRCVKTDSVHVRRFRNFSCFEGNDEDRREHRSCPRKKICDRPLEEHRNACRCLKKDRKTSPICNKPIKCSNNCNKSDSFLNSANNNEILEPDKSEFIYKRS